MSKSKKNVIDPDPVRRSIRRRRDAVVRAVRFATRARSALERRPGSKARGASSSDCGGWSMASTNRARAATPRSIASWRRPSPGSRSDIEALQFNKAVAKLYELVNATEKAAPSASRARGGSRAGAPRRADDTASGRRGLGGDGRRRGWSPTPSGRDTTRRLLVEDEVTIAIQVNGKLRDTLVMPKGSATGARSKPPRAPTCPRDSSCSTAPSRRR